MSALLVFKDAFSNRIDLHRRLRKSFAVLVFRAIIYPASYGQKPSSFEHFIQSVNNTPIAKRASLVTQYVAKAGATPIIEGNEKVHFVWFGKADTLKVEGELQRSWAIPQVMTRIDCGEQDFFTSRILFAPTQSLNIVLSLMAKESWIKKILGYRKVLTLAIEIFLICPSLSRHLT